MSNSLDPDLSGPGLGPNYLQRLSAGEKSRHRQGKRVKFLMAMDKSMLFYVSFSLVQWLFIKFSDSTSLSETDMQIDKQNYIG